MKRIVYTCDLCNREVEKFNISFYKRKHLLRMFSNKMYSKTYQICEICETDIKETLRDKRNNRNDK